MDANSAGGVERYDKCADLGETVGESGGGAGVTGNGGVYDGSGTAIGGGSVSGAVESQGATRGRRGGVDGGVNTRATEIVSGNGTPGTGRVGLGCEEGGGWWDEPGEREGSVEDEEATGGCFSVLPVASAAGFSIADFQPTATALAHSESPHCHSSSPLMRFMRSPKWQITAQVGDPAMTSENSIGNLPLQHQRTSLAVLACCNILAQFFHVYSSHSGPR